MGFHVCEFCGNASSSGDVTLAFENGHRYTMPDMILHYIAIHNYRPPDNFIRDVLFAEPAGSSRVQTKSLSGEEFVVGYLSGTFPVWADTCCGEKSAFFMRLWTLMEDAGRNGGRSQTRGATVPRKEIL